MGSIKKEYVMGGISAILIPLGAWVIKKIVSKWTDKLDSESGADEKNNLASDSQRVEEKV